jgi:glycosyltransferase involved in cell wall biosynthesis
LFINHTAEWSGAETSLMRLVETLGQRHEVIVACPGGGRLYDELLRRGVAWLALPATAASLRPHLVRTPTGVFQLLQAGMTATGIVRRVHPDVVHANGLRAGLIAAVPARLKAQPVLVQVHDVLPRNPLASAVRKTIVATADAVSAVSDKAAARFNEGLARPKAFPTHISIDHRRFDPDAADQSSLRVELGIGDAALLAQIAQITPWKGQDVAIEVLARLHKLEVRAHLAIVGGVSFASARYDNVGYESELHRLADRLGVAGSVHFLGPRDDVPGLMKTSDLTLLPSLDEPFGTAALESMAMGTPPIVSADGGMSEFVEDGVSGRVVARGNADCRAVHR